MITINELKVAQEFNFPGSFFMTDDEVQKWIESGSNTHLRLHLVELTDKYPVKLFYKTKEGYMGCRYGTNYSDYLSGFYSLERPELFTSFFERKKCWGISKLQLINLVSEYCILNNLDEFNFKKLMKDYKYLILPEVNK